MVAEQAGNRCILQVESLVQLHSLISSFTQGALYAKHRQEKAPYLLPTEYSFQVHLF